MSSDLSMRGHREVARDLPTPTGGPVWQRAALPALPAVSLSVASMVALLVVPMVLLADPSLRQLFRLPVATPWLAVPGAALAWLVVWGCRRRPGRHLPRYWALGLAVLATAVAALSPLAANEVLPWRYRPWADALAAGCLASALVLLPRLAPRRPDQSFFWIAPLAFLLAIPAVVLPALWTAGEAVEAHREELDRRLALLRQATEGLEAVAAHPWKTLPADPGAAQARVEALRRVTPAELLPTEEEWRVARILGPEEEKLATATAGLAGAVAGVLEGPGLGVVAEPPIRYDRGRRAWVANPDFPRLSGLVGEYYGEAGRLVRSLDGAGSAADLAARSQRWRTEARGRWNAGWLVPRFDGHQDEPPELSTLLRQPLASEGGSPVPADLQTLAKWSVWSLEGFAERSPPCHYRSYEEDGTFYRRLDCYAFEPDPESPGARLRLEMRLVYASSDRYFTGAERRPQEVYFLFPVPEGISPTVYGDQVIRELFQAVTASGSGPVRTSGRGASPAEGFTLGEEGDGVTVYRPRVVPYFGQQRAVEVRAVPSFRT